MSGANLSLGKPRRRWIAALHNSPLHLRISAVVLVLLLLLGAALSVLSHHFASSGALEATQRLQLDLARNMVTHAKAPLISASGSSW